MCLRCVDKRDASMKGGARASGLHVLWVRSGCAREHIPLEGFWKRRVCEEVAPLCFSLFFFVFLSVSLFLCAFSLRVFFVFLCVLILCVCFLVLYFSVFFFVFLCLSVFLSETQRSPAKP